MFFDYYVFTEGSFTNVNRDGMTIGYQLKTRIPYYRGVPLSMIAGVELEVDNQRIDPKSIQFKPSEGESWYSLQEMKTITNKKWEFGTEAIVFVEKQGGLEMGEHKLTLRVTITVAYAPINFMGECSRLVKV